MEVLHESPLSIIGPEESSFPRKRAATEADIENKYTIKTLQHLSQGINRVISGRCSLDPLLQVHDALLGGLITQAPSASSVVRSFSGISLPGSHNNGQLKKNQDSLIIFEDQSTNSFICACLDGHGLHGQTISNVFGQEIRNRLCSHPLFVEDIEQAIYDVLMSIEFDIYKQEARLADYSGTTVALAVIRDRQVTVANVGDSRVVLGKRRRILHRHSHPQSHQQHHNNEHSLKHPSSSSSSSSLSHPTLIDALPLSVDHKPHLPSEHARILAAGGRVFSVRYEDGMIGPPRVWLGGFDLPGLAMSRSLGDFVVHTAGVISRPDIIHYELHNDEDCYLVVGTDGLWDVLNNQEVLSLVHQCKSPHEGILRLFQEARARWWLKDNGIDDTTVCVMHFHASPQTRSRNNSAASVNTAATSTDMSVYVESHECCDDRNTDHNLADNIAIEKSSNDIQLFDNIKLDLSAANLPISDSK